MRLKLTLFYSPRCPARCLRFTVIRWFPVWHGAGPSRMGNGTVSLIHPQSRLWPSIGSEKSICAIERRFRGS